MGPSQRILWSLDLWDGMTGWPPSLGNFYQVKSPQLHLLGTVPTTVLNKDISALCWLQPLVSVWPLTPMCDPLSVGLCVCQLSSSVTVF